MRLQRLLLLVIPFMFFLPGAGLCEGKDAVHPNGKNQPIPNKVMGTCKTIAAILVVYPALEVRKSEGQGWDLPGISERPGCRIMAFGPTSGIAGEIDPAEALRGQFQGDGWREDIRYAADGPGTTSFAFRKNGILCMVSGGAHSWIEDGKAFTSERYELESGCVSDPDGAAPGH
jgi:hypothetical protein